ncbi:hypothetical protein BJX76DRAFT_204111 [Aspergillus varians]
MGAGVLSCDHRPLESCSPSISLTHNLGLIPVLRLCPGVVWTPLWSYESSTPRKS